MSVALALSATYTKERPKIDFGHKWKCSGHVEFLEKRLENERIRVKHINTLLWKELCKKKKKKHISVKLRLFFLNGPQGTDIETVW